jgi:hypothetical protein
MEGDLEQADTDELTYTEDERRPFGHPVNRHGAYENSRIGTCSHSSNRALALAKNVKAASIAKAHQIRLEESRMAAAESGLVL